MRNNEKYEQYEGYEGYEDKGKEIVADRRRNKKMREHISLCVLRCVFKLAQELCVGCARHAAAAHGFAVTLLRSYAFTNTI